MSVWIEQTIVGKCQNSNVPFWLIFKPKNINLANPTVLVSRPKLKWKTASLFIRVHHWKWDPFYRVIAVKLMGSWSPDASSKVHFCMKNQGCSSKDFFSIKIQKVMSKPHLMFKIFHALSKIENSLDFFSCNCFASLMPWALRKNFYVNDIGQETRCTVFENHPKCLIEVFKNSPKLTIFGIFNKLLSTQKCQRSSLRSQCWMRLFSVIFKHCVDVMIVLMHLLLFFLCDPYGCEN